MYDIIGDIHGHADELVELLTALGYQEESGCFRHSSRTAVFCGDFVDRGPQIPDVVRIVHAMVKDEAAAAVMGNHEFNALAFHTEDPEKPGEFLRPHTKKNVHQHSATLDQFDERELQDALQWFATLPVAIDLGSLRVVHACWDPVQLRVLENEFCRHEGLTDDLLRIATAVGHPIFNAIECVMKGPELQLPKGLSVTDKEGNVRKRIRIRWFESPENHTWASYSLPAKPELPDYSVPVNAPAVPYPSDAPPVFIGHYWLQGNSPELLKPNIACLDYSVARHGMLCAYRFDGESKLAKDRFVTVPSRSRGDGS